MTDEEARTVQSVLKRIPKAVTYSQVDEYEAEGIAAGGGMLVVNAASKARDRLRRKGVRP